MNYLNKRIIKTGIDSVKDCVTALVHTLHQGGVLGYKQLVTELEGIERFLVMIGMVIRAM